MSVDIPNIESCPSTHDLIKKLRSYNFDLKRGVADNILKSFHYNKGIIGVEQISEFTKLFYSALLELQKEFEGEEKWDNLCWITWDEWKVLYDHVRTINATISHVRKSIDTHLSKEY